MNFISPLTPVRELKFGIILIIIIIINIVIITIWVIRNGDTV